MSIFKNDEFETKYNSLLVSISKYVESNNIDLEGLEVKELIGWHDEDSRVIYASNICPVKIKEKITTLILAKFPERS